jgi:hypothetical protein
MHDPARSHGTEGLERRVRLKARNRRVMWVSLAISLALHALVVLIYSTWGETGIPGVTLPPTVDPDGSQGGTQIIAIAEQPPEESTQSLEPPEPLQPEPDEAPAPSEAPSTGVGPETDAEESTVPGHVADLLRPLLGDSVLWRQVDPALTELSDQEELELRLRWALTEWNEAMTSERAARDAALDWTYTDDEGNTWGVSPGKLHLGKITVPLPIGFGPPPGRSADLDRRAFEDLDIDRAEGRARAWETWEERGKAIRERVDRERARERAQKGDTTGVGR